MTVTLVKNDAHDARATRTAVQQPGVKAVALRSEEQQAVLRCIACVGNR